MCDIHFSQEYFLYLIKYYYAFQLLRKIKSPPAQNWAYGNPDILEDPAPRRWPATLAGTSALAKLTKMVGISSCLFQVFKNT